MRGEAGRWLAMLAGAALAILLQGVAVPNNANSYHWPIVLDWLRSAEGPHDLFTQSLDNYLSHFYTLLAWVADEATIAPLFYLLHLLVMLAVVAALRTIYALLAPAGAWRATLAAAATPVLLHGYVVSPLGHGELLLDSLSHSSLVVALVLWGWALALKGRPLAAALVMGLGFNVKNFTAAWGGLSLAGPVLLEWICPNRQRSLADPSRAAARPAQDEAGGFVDKQENLILRSGAPAPRLVAFGGRRRRLGWARSASIRSGQDRQRSAWSALATLALMFLVFALAATPTLLWLAERWEGLGPGAAAFDSRDFLRAFYPGHVMVGTHPVPEILAGAFFILTFPPLWLRLRAGAPAAPWRALLGLWLASLAIVLFALVLPLVTGNHMLLNSSPLRIDAFLDWLFFIALGVLVLRQPRWSSLALAAALALMAGRLPAALLLLLWQARGSSRWPMLLAVGFAALVAVTGALPQVALYDRLGGGLALLALLLALPFFAPRHGQTAERLVLIGAVATLDYAWSVGLIGPQPISTALLVAAFALSLSPRPLPRFVLDLTVAAAGIVYVRTAVGGDLRMAALLGLAFVPPAILWLLLRRYAMLQRFAPLAAAAAIAALLLAQPLHHLWQTGRLDRYAPAEIAFLELQRWARQATPPGSLFLQPDTQLRPNFTPSFWTYARRPAWVDWRQGAAVHWLPDFYPLWRQRMTEVTALADVGAKLAYAQAHTIPYVILAADEALPAGAPAALYEDGFWRVLPAR